MSWISIHAIHSHLREGIEARFPALLERRAHALEQWLFESRTRLLEAVRTRPALLRHRSGARADAELATLLVGNGGLIAVAHVDPTGRVTAIAGAHEPAWLAERLAEVPPPSLLDARFLALPGPSGQPAIVSAVALGEPERAASSPALVLAVFDREGVIAHLTPEDARAPGQLALLSADGLRIAASPIAPRPDLPFPLSRLGADEGLLEYTRQDGEHVLALGHPLIDGRWMLVVEAPFEEVFAPVLSVEARIFFSDLVIILAFSFLAYKITATIMQPIEALSEGALRVSRGDIDHDIPMRRSNDEIGLLTRAFNDMMRKLRDSQRELEEDRERLTEQNEELQSANEVLAQLSITDGLTKLHNHRYFQDHLTREIKRLSRTGEDLSMILLDLDDFKKLNDRHGHAAGDEVLVRMARLMNDNVRESDLLARYGGEEFVILTPGTNLEGAVSLAEKIRMSAENSPQIVDDTYRAITVTLSCGVAQFRGDRKLFFREADRALYRAKAMGKNCVVAAEPETDPEDGAQL